MVIRTRNPRSCADHYQLKLSFPEGWTASKRLTTSAGGFSDTQIVRVILALLLLILSVSPLPIRVYLAHTLSGNFSVALGENREVSRHIRRTSPLPRRKFGLAEPDGNCRAAPS